MAIETGLSDHHKMVITVLKNYCKQGTCLKYRSYKHRDMPKYKNILKENLGNFDKEITKYEDFHEICKGSGQVCSIKTKQVKRNTDHS